MCTINYHFRPSAKKGDHPGRIFIRIIYKRRVLNIATPYKISQKDWDLENNCIRMPPLYSPGYFPLQDLKETLAIEIEQLYQKANQLQQENIFNLSEFSQYYRKYKNEIMLSVYTGLLINRLTRARQERTARAYQSVVNSVRLFNNGKDISLCELDEVFLGLYEKHLKAENKGLNTISFYMRNLRSIFNKAIYDKLIEPPQRNPFQKVYTGIQKTRKRALNKKEIKQLYSLHLAYISKNRSGNQFNEKLYDESLQNALSIFLFSFHARGMSFVDIAYLQKENIRNGFICYYRKKTGRLIEIKLNAALEKIINSFQQDGSRSSYIFPIIQPESKNERLQYESALRVYNMRLQRIGELLKLNKPLTSHVARHTWASLAKSENLPLWVICEGLGHSNEKTTYIYLSSLDHSVIDQANEKIYRAIKL